jgi:hypothetical protein
LQGFLWRFRQPIDPSHDDVLDRVGNQNLVEGLREDIAILDLSNGTDLLQRLDHFFDKKGVPLGLPKDRV